MNIIVVYYTKYKAFYNYLILAGLFLLFLFASNPVLALPQFYKNKIDRAFEALKIYNYFESRDLFLKSSDKYPCVSNYGLSLIYFRDDNPFHNYDSSYTRILNAFDAYSSLTKKDSAKTILYEIDSISLANHKSKVEAASFKIVLDNPGITSLQKYIDYYKTASQVKLAIRMRDSLAFELAEKEHTSRGYNEFMVTYPESHLLNEAKTSFDKTLFHENTSEDNIDSYKEFIDKYPDSPYIAECHRKIYEIYTSNSSDADVYYSFINSYNNSPLRDEAWQRIYDLYMLDYEDDAVEKFILRFPDYPFQQQLVVESKLAKEVYLPFVNNGKWGFINESGQIVIESKYDFVEFFHEGLAVVSRDGKSGYINKSGEEIIAPFFDEVENFKNSYAVVSENEKFGLVNRSGRMVVPLSYSDMGDVNEGLAVVFTDDKCGYISRSGSEVIETRYTSCGDFMEKRAICEFNELFGIIDENGNEIIPFNYSSIVAIDSHLVKVQLNNLWGIYHISGTQILPCEYDEIGDAGDDRIMIVQNKKMGYVNALGVIAIPMTFETFTGQLHKAQFKSGYAVVQKRQYQGLIDTSGNFVIPNKYDEIIAPSENLIPVNKNGKWGFVNLKTGKNTISYKFNKVTNFNNNFAISEDKNGWNIINVKGQAIFKESYSEINYVKNDKYIVELNDKIGLVNTKSDVIIPIKFDKYILFKEKYLQMTSDSLQCWYDLDNEKYIFNFPVKDEIPIINNTKE